MSKTRKVRKAFDDFEDEYYAQECRKLRDRDRRGMRKSRQQDRSTISGATDDGDTYDR